MNTCNGKLKLLEPSLSDKEDGIKAWFTLKNAKILNKSATIPGLNLGLNTDSNPKEIIGNRDLLFKQLNLDLAWTAFAVQVHGTHVQLITNGGTYPQTDGLVTCTPGLTLGIQVADCAAVLLADPVHKVIAAIHAGWRGGVGNILVNALDIMKGEGAQAKEIRAYISPCICQAHFEVGNEVAEQFPEQFVDYKNYKKPHVDLKEFLKYQLLEEGLLKGNIQIAEGCTMEDSELFYSYRREKDRSGRMIGLIRILD